jgi:hypothetical protein
LDFHAQFKGENNDSNYHNKSGRRLAGTSGFFSNDLVKEQEMSWLLISIEAAIAFAAMLLVYASLKADGGER